MRRVDIIIVGAGISGATLAERFATQLNKKVLVIEKRDHIGGNCYDYYNDEGILIHKYGPHLFHTNDEGVWEYINKFSEWYFYELRVLSNVGGTLVPLPVNVDTVNRLFKYNLDEQGMKEWLQENQMKFENPQNSEEMALSRIGKDLYEKMVKHYVKKMWDKYPEELDASVLERIPVRFTHDDRYFTDKYQFLPSNGYTKLFEKMLDHPNISVILNTDYFDIQSELTGYEKILYTGPIDRYFDYRFESIGKLQYRSLRFEHETINQEYYQSAAVVSYPDDKHDFNRIVEPKHFTKQKHSKTTIIREYGTWDGEPYYPVPNPENHKIYNLYQKEAAKLEDVVLVGRLANYKYFNMDQAFRNALDLFERVKDERK